jgi:hypothetical protein
VLTQQRDHARLLGAVEDVGMVGTEDIHDCSWGCLGSGCREGAAMRQ